MHASARDDRVVEPLPAQALLLLLIFDPLLAIERLPVGRRLLLRSLDLKALDSPRDIVGACAGLAAAPGRLARLDTPENLIAEEKAALERPAGRWDPGAEVFVLSKAGRVRKRRRGHRHRERRQGYAAIIPEPRSRGPEHDRRNRKTPARLHRPQMLIGAAYGLIGAYLFVVLQLGYRSLQQDITPGAAAWCAATLAVGPLVAGVIAVGAPPIWPSKPNVDVGRVALYVMAGFSPRYAVGVIESLAKRLMPGISTTSIAARVVPVNQVRGISDEIAVRLAEEGITSVTAMAYSNPIRLLRNTRFDKRQILAWIDCALLMDSLPEHWAALERVGITNATSLRWYALSRDARSENGVNRLAELATVAGVDRNGVLSAGERLAHDPQVLTVLVLDEYEESDGDAPEDHGTPSAEASPHSTVTAIAPARAASCSPEPRRAESATHR